MEAGHLHFGGASVYDLPEDELVSVIARIMVRDHRDGWGNTLAPISTVEMVFLNGMVARRRKNKKKGPGAGDEQGRIDAFLGAA